MDKETGRQGDKEKRLEHESPCLPLSWLMRRVLHIIDSLDRTSATNQLSVLAEALAREGFQVQIAELDVTRIPRYRDGPAEGSSGATSSIPITPLGRRMAIDPLAFVRLARLVRGFQPDIVQTWDLSSAVYASASLVRLPQRWQERIRSLGLGPKRPRLVMGLYHIQPWRPSWQWILSRRLAGHADGLVTSSPSVCAWYAERGLPADRFTIVPPAAPLRQSCGISRGELLRELRLPADSQLIGVLGRLVPENRVKDLIWAADLLRVLHNNLRVLIIGDGPLRSQLEEYARLASDLEHIQFLGNQNDVARIVPHLDVLWNASENVGPSSAILDAMAAGVPVIASDTPSNRELVVENATGYLIPLGTRAGRAARARHTDRIFTDAELAGRLSRAARQRATDRFFVRRYLSDYWELYSRICD
jgi:glycosyltransferase involved in cell wall biosynthesis